MDAFRALVELENMLLSHGLALWIAPCLAPVALAAPTRPAQDARPNILFVFTDDHAAHAISAYGSRLGETPNIDRLAREGMLFRNAFVGNSICAPARATILTGLHSHANGVYDNSLPFDGSQRTFPKLLREAGYQTAMIGKWHLKSDPTGFDHWEVLRGQGPYYNPPMNTPDGVREHVGYTTDVITDLALEWLQSGREDGKPFLLMYQHKAPHREWAPGPEHLTLFEGVDLPEPATLFDDWEGRTSGAKTQTMTIASHMSRRDLKLDPPNNLTPEQLAAWEAAYGPKNAALEAAELEGEALVRWKYQRYVKDYMRCIRSVDENLGRVLDYLDESGLAERTVVVYASDQGFYLGDHGWYDKRWMYEESLRMPLLVRWPGTVAPGSVDEHLVQNVDLAPTLLAAAGVEPPAGMHGESLVPLLRGEEPDWRNSIYYHYYEGHGPHDVPCHYGVRTRRYKLVRYYELDEWELFDLEADPDELRSVYADPGYTLVLEGLKAELARLQEGYGDTEPDTPMFEIVQSIALAQAEGSELKLIGEAADPRASGGTGSEPYWRPFTVGIRCRAEAGASGVLTAHGGGSHGYSLYLRDGRPCFALRSRGELYSVEAIRPLPVGELVHVAGIVDREGRLNLYVGGDFEAQGVGVLLTSRPAEPLSFGDDGSSAVGDYDAPGTFAGELSDWRFYQGVLPAAELRAWARGG